MKFDVRFSLTTYMMNVNLGFLKRSPTNLDLSMILPTISFKNRVVKQINLLSVETLDSRLT